MTNISPKNLKRSTRAFTIIEVLVSSTLIVVIMGMLFSVVDNTQKLWQKTTSSINQFQSARTGFEAITRRVSQATLNTYWQSIPVDPANASSQKLFRRQAELQFLSGPAATILGNPVVQHVPGAASGSTLQKIFPGHGMFFQAPLGYTEETVNPGGPLKFRQLDRMLMGCGFFVEFGMDPDRPQFLNDTDDLKTAIPPRQRFRLIELSIPSEKLNIFDRPKDDNANLNNPVPDPNYIGFPQILDTSNDPYAALLNDRVYTMRTTSWKRPRWMQEGLTRIAPINENGAKFKHGRVLAENVLALIVLPKIPRSETSTNSSTATQGSTDTKGSTMSAPEYAYDSWRALVNASGINLIKAPRDNLLPSSVQITMVAIDEPSALRMNVNSTNIPNWMEDESGVPLFKDAANYADDLISLEKKIQAMPGKINYRIFTMDVAIRSSKWSKAED